MVMDAGTQQEQSAQPRQASGRCQRDGGDLQHLGDDPDDVPGCVLDWPGDHCSDEDDHDG